jgi:hypothetical protein
MRVCAYCLMPDHWHFVLWPEQKQLLSAWPVAYPKGWRKLANEPQTDAEVDAIRCFSSLPFLIHQFLMVNSALSEEIRFPITRQSRTAEPPCLPRASHLLPAP